MFKKENLINLLIAVVVFLILGAISVALALDPNMGLVKKKNENNIIITNTLLFITYTIYIAK